VDAGRQRRGAGVGLAALGVEVLMEALKRLQAEGLASRSTNGDGAVYELTNAGRDLLPVLMDLWANWKRWSQKHVDSRAKTAK
jgi:DNA-binding HxlR family transcriptional regulator